MQRAASASKDSVGSLFCMGFARAASAPGDAKLRRGTSQFYETFYRKDLHGNYASFYVAKLDAFFVNITGLKQIVGDSNRLYMCIS